MEEERTPNSNECIYNGRKLSNTTTHIKVSKEIIHICIGSVDDDTFDALSERSQKENRITIGLEIDDPNETNWLEIDLEDILRFARKYCNGIYKRIQSEVKPYQK